MSDLLSAAAAALGTPEALVQRSAEARAAETGASVDEILAAWAGEAPVPAAEPEAEPPPEPAEEQEEQPTTEQEPSEEPEVEIEVPAAAAPAPAEAPTRGPQKPPVLVGVRDNPMSVLLGAVGLFLVMFLVGFVGPSIPVDTPGARTSQIPYSAQAETGKSLYASLGCAACHTQMVRPVVADVGLGAVTLNDSNQVLGVRRFGPDLSNVGTRLTSPEIEAIVSGLGDHPRYRLAPEDMSSLVAYLSESRTSS